MSTKTGTLMFCGFCEAGTRVNKGLFSQTAGRNSGKNLIRPVEIGCNSVKMRV